jgi:hypothetical protein
MTIGCDKFEEGVYFWYVPSFYGNGFGEYMSQMIFFRTFATDK